jgi:hypothetical protein
MNHLRRLVLRTTRGALFLFALLPPGLALAASEAAKHEEPGIVNLNITTVIQAVNFLILIALLSKFLFNPLRKFLAERAQGIEKSLAEAKLAREAAVKAQEDRKSVV